MPAMVRLRSHRVARWLGIAPFQLSDMRKARQDGLTTGWVEHTIRQLPGDSTRGGGRQPNRFEYALQSRAGVVQWTRPVRRVTHYGTATVSAPYGAFFRSFTDADGHVHFWPRTSLIPNPCVRPAGGAAHA